MSGNNIFRRIVETFDDGIIYLYEHPLQIITILTIFTLGFSIGVLTVKANKPVVEKTKGDEQITNTLTSLLMPISEEKISPQDWIKEDQIHVYNDKIIIDLKNAEWATFTDTNSMDPVIDFGANAIEIIPSNSSFINVGDIISYNSEYASGTIIHRVIEVGNDENGWYCKTKGDNNQKTDPGKIRFTQIQRLVVAVIY